MATLLATASTSSRLMPTASRDCVCSLVESKISSLRTQRQRSRGYGVPLVTSSLQSQNGGGEPAICEANLVRPLINVAAAAAFSLSISLCGVVIENLHLQTLHTTLLELDASKSVDFALARPEGVNRPELLPKDFTTVIDVAGFLSPQQEGRIAQDVASIEEETGFKLRVLAQNYPETPGLAVKNFWKVDDNTIVFVADPNMGNILNFNVGSSVDLNVPRSFWSRLAGKYGNIFFWREQGEDASIEAAVAAIGQCLREPAGPYACAEIK